jgi:hypothetical protein
MWRLCRYTKCFQIGKYFFDTSNYHPRFIAMLDFLGKIFLAQTISMLMNITLD